MKTAAQWRTEYGHMKTKPVHPAFFEQVVIEQIQKDAFKAGMTRAAEIAKLYCETVDHALAPKAILAERDKIP